MFKRILAIIMTFSIIAFSTIGRLGYIIFSNNYAVDKTYNSRNIIIDKLDVNFYYSNGTKINNNTKNLVAIIKPNEKCISELDVLFDRETKQSIIEELSKSNVVIRKVDKYVKLKYIDIKEVVGSDYDCKQLLSKSCNGLLSRDNTKIGNFEANIKVDALGRPLPGESIKYNYSNYNSKYGYKLTIDKRIQQITEDACKNLDNGCAIVMNVDSFEILSMVTTPYDSYLNKPLLQYNPGSIFKIIVALCAIENNIDISYNCTGSIKVGDATFSCQKGKKHSNQTLKEAIANSCNCYFVNLMNVLGYEKVIETAHKMGFDSVINLFNDWNIKSSTLPNKKELISKGEQSLFSFGQGKVTVSPLQMAYCLCIIANGGYKAPVRLVKSKVSNDGKVLDYPVSDKTRIIETEDCKKMIDYLSYVVTNGTGKNAQSITNQSAGKTATAQTGRYSNDKEILNTWFIGIYPNDNPKYAIVIMNEDGTSGSKDCCPIFRTIVENL